MSNELDPNSSEYKWLTFPMQSKLEMLANLEKLEVLMEKQIKLRREMRDCLLHKWMSHDQKDPASITFTEKTFIQFVKRYYKSLRDGAEQFEFMSHQFLTAYAKYMIEYLEPQMVAVSKDAYVNNAERRLREIRKHHEITMKIKEDPNYDPPPSYHPDRI
jgi:hypothetical protein